MVEVLEDLQALLDDLVALLALDVGDEADAAGVVLVVRVVQTLRGGNRVNRLLVIVHGDTVCEGPDRPLNRFSIAAVRIRNRDGALRRCDATRVKKRRNSEYTRRIKE